MPLGDGTFRVTTVTTTTAEEVVDAEGLARLGLKPPYVPPPLPPDAKEATRALHHWMSVVHTGLDNRIRSIMPEWVKEFGLERVISAMDVVAAERSRVSLAAKYKYLAELLRKPRADE